MSAPSAPAPTLPRGLQGYFYLLRTNPDIRNVWSAQVVSQLGDWFNTVALLGIINRITADPIASSLVAGFTVLPSAISSLTIGGYIADRIDRKKLAIAVDIIRAVVALGLLLVSDASTLWIAYLCIGCLAVGEALFNPAVSAAQPNLCEPHELSTANALQQSTWASVSMLGAMLGGIVTILFSPQAAFVLNGVSFLISAWFLLKVRKPFSKPGQRAGGVTFAALTGGARFLLSHPIVLGISVAKTIWAFTFTTYTLYSVYAFQIYGTGDWGTSLLFAARGIGSFIGPVLVQTYYVPKTLRQFTLIISASFVLCIGGYALWGLTNIDWLGALGIFFAHLGAGSLWTYSRIYVQRETPDNLRGRVLALDAVGFTLVIGVFSLLLGTIARTTTPATSVLFAVGLTTVLAAIWGVWMWKLNKVNA